jgi:hypothetical protein
MLRSSVLRASSSISCFAPVRASSRVLRASVVYGNIQTRNAHAISNPTLANIESRWDTMPPQEQADLWMALRDRMKNDWNELTMQEKKAGTYSLYPLHPPIRCFGICLPRIDRVFQQRIGLHLVHMGLALRLRLAKAGRLSVTPFMASWSLPSSSTQPIISLAHLQRPCPRNGKRRPTNMQR